MFTHTIIKEVKSHSKGNVYAKASEKVFIVSVHDHVAIVESEKGARFPTQLTNLKEINKK